MKVYGKADIHSVLYKDLEKGDVFIFLKDCKDLVGRKVYMRCGHTSENSAVNLETGICYSFDDGEPVEIVDATLNIKAKDTN